MPQAYRHQPLASEDRIRLVDLLPAWKRDTPIRCRIRQVRLEDARDKYDALSYVWGAREGSVPIACDGYELLVTPNCYDAIIELRHGTRVRPLWIDSICINQSAATCSTKERNHQVKLMGRSLLTAPKPCGLHDKIYGLYAIFEEMDIQLPDPDYGQPIHEVLEEVTRAIISSQQSIKLVTSERAGHELPQLPSWIPMLLTPRPDPVSFPDTMGYLGGRLYSSSRGSKTYISAKKKKSELDAKGRRIGILQTKIGCSIDQTAEMADMKEFRLFLQACQEYCQSWSAVPLNVVEILKHLTFRDAAMHYTRHILFWHDIMLYPHCRIVPPQQIVDDTICGNQEDPLTVVCDYLCNGQSPNSKLAREIQTELNRDSNWAFVRTDNGYGGRAYRTCETGDEVWLLAGATNPVILRPTGAGFQYIAPAYLRGMMEGELWPDDEEDLEILTLV
ncbi:hypothetical protein PG994_013718 [Apiospora phragmitis]|uniref:Heterokaryon incompatibility domain-containing protein n=1 Tax=Apiospora phragmitis TaxID=2905665 RepID=A0ABR1TB91_9PEZI